MALGGVYTTGSVSTDPANNRHLTFSGALLSTQGEQGDWVFANGAIGLVESVDGDLDVTLQTPWLGGTLTDAPFILIKMSWIRYDPSVTQAKIRELLAALDAQGTFIYVAGDAPEDSLGKDGQWAIKINDGPWKVWYRQNGTWKLQGSPIGPYWAGMWNTTDNFPINAIVHRLGSTYVSLKPENTNNPPESNSNEEDPDRYWDIHTVGGSRYDFIVDIPARPASGMRVARWICPSEIFFPAALIQSAGNAGTAPTVDAIFHLEKNGTEFATITFAAGETSPNFSNVSGAVFESGDIFEVYAPTTRDDTLADIAITIVATR